MSVSLRLLASRGQQPSYLAEAAFPSYAVEKSGENPGVKTPSPVYRHTSPSDEHLSGAKTQQRLGLATRLCREGLCCRVSLGCFFKHGRACYGNQHDTYIHKCIHTDDVFYLFLHKTK
jgi:hypothetical protein